MPKFSDLFVKNAPEGIHWDDITTGLGVRVGKKRRSFIVLVDSGRRKSIGVYPDKTLADARADAKVIRAEKTLGKVVPQHRAYNDVKEEYLAVLAERCRPLTIRDYTRHLNKTFPFRRKSVGDITPTHILKRLSTLNHSPAQKRYAFAIGRAFFKYCMQQHIIQVSPFASLKSPPALRSRERVLERDELKKIWGTLKTYIENGYSSHFHHIVALLLLTGQRRNEITNLHWEWIEEEEIVLPWTITKNKRPNIVPITQQINLVLDVVPHIDDSPYLFPASKKRSEKTTVFNGFSKAKREFDTECGVTGWQLHDLRRSVSSYMAELGVQQIVVEKLLNHVSGGSQSQIAQVYNRYEYLTEVKEALVRWHEFLDKL